MRLDGNNVAFCNGAWSVAYPDIAIFDSVFVHNNLYAGDYVDHEHKKNLYRIIVGQEGVRLAKQIEELDRKIRDANANIRTKRDALLRSAPNGVAAEAYLAWKPIEEIEAKIQQKAAEVANRQRTVDRAAEIQSRDLLSKIALPVLPSNFLPTLSKQVTDIAADAENRVRQQIAAHSMGVRGEVWLSQGLDFVDSDRCPFCGQDISGNELIAAYKSHFNAAYRELKEEVAQLTQYVNSSIGESSLGAVQKTLSGNSALVEFWKQFIAIKAPDFSFEDAFWGYSALREVAAALAQTKHESPTEPITPGEDFQAAFDAVAALRQSAQSYNEAVDACNVLIDQHKLAARQDAGIKTLKDKLADLEAKKRRFEPQVVQACQEYQDALNEKAALEHQKTMSRERLDQHCQQILETYQESINTYLDQFNAAFRIANSRHLYTGGTPSSHYQIEINNNIVDLGDSRTQPGTACFRTTLSSGDRSALALAFFLAAMKQDSEIGKKIVLLDDPFMSQDRFRRTCTQQLIRQLAGMAKQVIVLSHDPRFLRSVWEGYPDDEIKVLQLLRTGNSTVIGKWDIEAETQSTYLKDYSVLLDYYRERKGNPLQVARSIRPFVEGMLRAHFPGHFQPNEWLGNFVDKTRNDGGTGGLAHARDDLAEIQAINEYSKKYHHDQNPNADSEPLSEDELHGFVKRTLRLVAGVMYIRRRTTQTGMLSFL